MKKTLNILFIFVFIFSVNAISYKLLNDEKYSKINEIKNMNS